MNLKSPITELKGIGEKTAKSLEKLQIYNVGDLIRYFPRTYQIFDEPVLLEECETGMCYAVRVTLSRPIQNISGRRSMITTATFTDQEGDVLRASWFHMPYLRHSLRMGQEVILRGNIAKKKGVLFMEHPEIFSPPEKYYEKLNTMQPVYALTAGVTNNTLLKAMKQALSEMILKDPLPAPVRLEYALAGYDYSVRNIHFPENKETFILARNRLVFDEFFQFILAVRQEKNQNERRKNAYEIRELQEVETFLENLPYTLTQAQQKAWTEIRADLTGSYTMSRLLQGDVGSGKTILAMAALMLVALQGLQGAMMAPTEVLARQHYESFERMFETYQIPLRTALLTGSMTAKEKREVYARIASGEVQIIIGTHALIQDAVEYQNLALVITDEQHRFGVRQRESFAEKGLYPHILVMSATPIPRTLAIIIYGDLDISVINELPADRRPIKNCVVDTNYRPKAYEFMRKQIREGRQCYVICAMVEESDNIEAENVMDYAAMLQEEFGSEAVVAYLHGKMKQKEKDDIMQRFADNEIQILVSTTVVEVGINVPNATVMMVENAERFGLAQLHQLRGRVGRGKHQSYCIFISESKSKETKRRLEILNKSNDGFYIASEDLKLRGPGDLFGLRQSGMFDFQLGDVFQDANILQMANEAVARYEQDPEIHEELMKYAGYANMDKEMFHIL
jgi:ATP-dependent DNA helicase RecG